MGVALLSLVAVSAAVGCQAQLMKGRTGAAWGLLTFVLPLLRPVARRLLPADACATLKVRKRFAGAIDGFTLTIQSLAHICRLEGLTFSLV